jgi:hypothetical protein
VYVRNQATVRLAGFVTREKPVPPGIFNNHRFDGTIETPSLMERRSAIDWLCCILLLVEGDHISKGHK